MAETDDQELVKALNYLGKGPYNVGMPGGGDVTTGAGPAPAPGINVGSFGQLGDRTAGADNLGAGGTAATRSDSAGGSDILAMLQKALGIGGKAGDIAKKLGASGPSPDMDVLNSMAQRGELSLGADNTLSFGGGSLPSFNEIFGGESVPSEFGNIPLGDYQIMKNALTTATETPAGEGLNASGLFTLGGGAEGGAGGGNLGGGTIQGLMALYNLISGIQGNNPGQIGSGVLSGVGAADALTGVLGGTGANYLGPAGAFVQGLTGPNPGNPATAGAAGSQLAQTATVAPAATIASTLTPTIVDPYGLTGPALGVAMAINQALNPKTNYDINKIGGQLGPQVTQNTGDIFQALQGADLSQVSDDQLRRLIPFLGGDLASGFNTLGAGTGTGTSQTALSRYLSGLQGSDPNAFSAYQTAQQGNTGSLLQAIAQLQRRGVTNQDIGGLMTPQLENIWDAFNPALPGAMNTGQQYVEGGLGPQQWAGAYGGPTWAALAKFVPPELLAQYGIAAPAYAESPELQAGLAARQGAVDAARYQDFTSGGGS